MTTTYTTVFGLVRALFHRYRFGCGAAVHLHVHGARLFSAVQKDDRHTKIIDKEGVSRLLIAPTDRTPVGRAAELA